MLQPACQLQLRKTAQDNCPVLFGFITPRFCSSEFKQLSRFLQPEHDFDHVRAFCFLHTRVCDLVVTAASSFDPTCGS